LTARGRRVGSEPSYVSHQAPGYTAEGKLLIIMPDAEREFIYEDAAQSFPGSNHTLIAPMGAIMAEIRAEVFGRCFAQRCSLRRRPCFAERYAIAIDPDLANFVYHFTDWADEAEFDEPQAEITPHVKPG
jgi:hypothetical protein